MRTAVGVIPPEKPCTINAVPLHNCLITSETGGVLLEEVARTFVAVGSIRAVDSGAVVTGDVETVLRGVAIGTGLRVGEYYECQC